MYDYNARFYSPYLNRFISPDTIVPDPIDSQAFNRYAYTNNNPLRYNDPSGHCPSCYEPQPPLGGEEVYVGWGVTTHVNPNIADRQKFGSLLVDFTPVIGDAKGFAEVFTGQDLMTGEDLGAWRWAGLVFLSELRAARHGDDVVDAWRATGRHLDEAGDFAGDYFGKYDVGQGFTGAFDASTGNFALRPSTEGILPSLEWAPIGGGHAYVGRDLFDDIESPFSRFGSHDPNWDTTYGFAVKYVGSGKLEIASWASGVLNAGKPGSVGRIPSKEVRNQMVDTLKEATGWDVVDPFD